MWMTKEHHLARSMDQKALAGLLFSTGTANAKGSVDPRISLKLL